MSDETSFTRFNLRRQPLPPATTCVSGSWRTCWSSSKQQTSAALIHWGFFVVVVFKAHNVFLEHTALEWWLIMLTLLCPTHSNNCGCCETPPEKQSKIVSSVNITGSWWQTPSRWSWRSSLVHRRTILSRSNYVPVLRGLRELICPAFASPIFTDRRVKHPAEEPVTIKTPSCSKCFGKHSHICVVRFRRHKRPQVSQQTS